MFPKSLFLIVVTVLWMVLVFYGVRGYVEDAWPDYATPRVEMLIYCMSALYGLYTYDWLRKWLQKRANKND